MLCEIIKPFHQVTIGVDTNNAMAICNETPECKGFIYKMSNTRGSVYNDDSQHNGPVYMLKSEITGHSKAG